MFKNLNILKTLAKSTALALTISCFSLFSVSADGAQPRTQRPQLPGAARCQAKPDDCTDFVPIYETYAFEDIPSNNLVPENRRVHKMLAFKKGQVPDNVWNSLKNRGDLYADLNGKNLSSLEDTSFNHMVHIDISEYRGVQNKNKPFLSFDAVIRVKEKDIDGHKFTEFNLELPASVDFVYIQHFNVDVFKIANDRGDRTLIGGITYGGAREQFVCSADNVATLMNVLCQHFNSGFHIQMAINE